MTSTQSEDPSHVNQLMRTGRGGEGRGCPQEPKQWVQGKSNGATEGTERTGKSGYCHAGQPDDSGAQAVRLKGQTDMPAKWKESDYDNTRRWVRKTEQWEQTTADH